MSRDRTLLALGALLVVVVALRGLPAAVPPEAPGDPPRARLSPAAATHASRGRPARVRPRDGTSPTAIDGAGAPARGAPPASETVGADGPAAEVVLVAQAPSGARARELPYELADPLTRAAIDVAALDLELARAELEGDRARVPPLREAREAARAERERLSADPAVGDAGR